MARIYTNEINSTKEGVLQFLRPNSRVLEFGPATGYATKYMQQELLCSVVAIELIPEMAKQVESYAEKVIVANIDEDSWEDSLEGNFDFIIFSDVLEHLRYPQRALERCAPFLKSDGCILTSVPNIGHNSIILNLRKGLFVYTNYGLLDDTHIHFFTRKSLFDMFHQINLVCAAENSILKRPCQTELLVHYILFPWMLFSLLRKQDGHVYQFVNCWKNRSNLEMEHNRPYQLNFFAAIKELCIDSASYCFHRLSKSTQLKIKKNCTWRPW